MHENEEGSSNTEWYRWSWDSEKMKKLLTQGNIVLSVIHDYIQVERKN